MVSPLRRRDFRRLWLGQTVSAAGDQVFPVAVAVAVLNSGGSTSDLGLVLAARFVSLVLLVLAGGVWADRLPRRLVMIGADAARAAAVLALAITPTHPPLWVLAALVFAVGGGEAFFQPAYAALVPTVLDPAELERGSALTSISRRGAAVVGPAVGGLLVASVGTRWAFALDAATFLVSLLTLVGVREPAVVPAPRTSAYRDIAEGIRAVRARPWIAAVLLTATVQLMLTVAPPTVLLPIVARERLGGDAAYGAMLACFSAGGVIGALLAARFTPRRPGLVGMMTLLAYAFVPLSLIAGHSPVLVAVVYLVAGIGIEPFIVYWTAAVARDVPRDLLARVSSLDWLSSFALMPLGLALTGPAVDAFGRAPVLIVAAVMAVVPNLLALAVPGVPEFRTVRRAGSPPTAHPAVAAR